MSNITVEELATSIGTTVEKLITQLADSGVTKSVNDSVTQEEKESLLGHLKKQHGDNSADQPKKMTLNRKTKSTLVMGQGSKAKSVAVETRKKRTYVKRSDVEIQQQAEEEAKAVELAAEEAKVNAEVKAVADAKEAENAKAVAAAKAEVAAEAKAEAKIEAAEKAKQVAAEKAKNAKEEPVKVEETAEAKALRKQHEAELAAKVEAEAKEAADAARKLADENSGRWKEQEEERKKKEQEVVHVTSSKYAQEAEDKNDTADEGKRRRRKKKPADRNARGGKPARGKGKKSLNAPESLQHGFTKPVETKVQEVRIGETISVAELANKMAKKGAEVVKEMFKLGSMATINQIIDQETAALVAEEMGFNVVLMNENALEVSILSKSADDSKNESAISRAPVVTIMGHVDHGKTSLLDHIRQAKVADGEAGGITQHIGAYHVETGHGVITFLDTPGHAAFTAMRSRGAKATDIVIIVVAADDGVMPQTVEAIQHAKASEAPIIIAVNKMDKEGADPDRVKNELSQHDVLPEDWGGDVQFIEVSAKTGLGIDNLLDAILIQSEVLELTAVVDAMASGVVIESKLDKGRGPVATVLVQQGTLKQGDIVLCGLEYGRVRAMRDENGKVIQSAGPSIPVEIIGLSGVPSAGDEATVVHDEKKAREVALFRQGKFRDIKLARQQKSKLENMFANMASGEISEVNVVIKSDVQGSLEAISDSLLKLSTDEVKVNIIGSGVGAITETDATLAAASNAIVVGFNVRADVPARKVIEAESIDLRYYSVIYALIDEVKQAMSGMLAPEFKQEIVGLAQVRDVFKSPKIGAIAGCMVTEGTIKRSQPIRVLRENVVIYEGELESLRRFKDDVQEVRNGIECGIGVKNYNDVRVGDQIEVFEMVEVIRTL